MNTVNRWLIFGSLVLVLSGCASAPKVNRFETGDDDHYYVSDEGAKIYEDSIAPTIRSHVYNYFSYAYPLEIEDLIYLKWSGAKDSDGYATGYGELITSYRYHGHSESYLGYMEKGKMKGQGSLVNELKEKLVGTFSNKWIYGKGTLSRINLDKVMVIYTGDFRGALYGFGTASWNGGSYEGEFDYGVKNGFGIEKDANGKIVRTGVWSRDIFWEAASKEQEQEILKKANALRETWTNKELARENADRQKELAKEKAEHEAAMKDYQEYVKNHPAETAKEMPTRNPCGFAYSCTLGQGAEAKTYEGGKRVLTGKMVEECRLHPDAAYCN